VTGPTPAGQRSKGPVFLLELVSPIAAYYAFCARTKGAMVGASAPGPEEMWRTAAMLAADFREPLFLGNSVHKPRICFAFIVGSSWFAKLRST
jgi:hypothetical protein